MRLINRTLAARAWAEKVLHPTWTNLDVGRRIGLRGEQSSVCHRVRRMLETISHELGDPDLHATELNKLIKGIRKKPERLVAVVGTALKTMPLEDQVKALRTLRPELDRMLREAEQLVRLREKSVGGSAVGRPP